MIDGRATESIVKDRRPAVSAFVVLPQPGGEFVQVQEPRGLLISAEYSFVKLREEF
jgi:hypothetical protein